MGTTSNQLLPWRYQLMIGWVMRGALWAARRQVHKHRFTFTFEVKVAEGRENDRVTNADILAQAAMLRWLRFWLRGIGIIAEENGCSIQCTLPKRYGNLVFVIDPLDGTKLYAMGVRGRSGVQMALIRIANGVAWEILAAYMCDIDGGLAYGYDPRTDGDVYCYTPRFGLLRRVKLISVEGPDTELHRVSSLWDIPRYRTLLGHKIVSRGQAGDLRVIGNELFADLLEPIQLGGLFKSCPFMGSGSPLVAATTALMGAAAGMVLMPHQSTIWDAAPFVGIMQQLGFWSFTTSEDGLSFVRLESRLGLEQFHEDQAVLWIHRIFTPELYAWAEQRTPARS